MKVGKEIFILLTLIHTLVNVHAQESGFSIGPSYSISKYFVEYDYSKILYQNIEIKGSLNQDFGASIYYSSGKKWGFETGLFYSLVQSKITYVFVGTQPNDPAIPKETKIRNSYVSIPLKGLISVIQNKSFGFFIQSGVTGMFFVGTKELTTFGDDKQKESNLINDNSQSFLMNWLVGCSLDYKTENVIFRVAPEISKSLIEIENGLVSNKPWIIGIQGKVLFTL